MPLELLDSAPRLTLRDSQAYSPESLADHESRLVNSSTQFGRGWQSAGLGDQAGELANRALQARLAGDSQAEAVYMQQAQDMQKRAQQWAPTVQNFTDINGLGSAADWVAGSMGNLRTSVPPAVGSLVGAGVGGAVGLGLRNAKLGAQVGSYLGGMTPGYQMERNEAALGAMTNPEILANNTPQQIDNAVMAKAGINAGLESLVPAGITNGLIGGAGRKIAKDQMLKAAGKEIAKNAGEEFATEGAQSLVGQGAENSLLGKDITNFDYKQAFNEGMAGAVAGGGMGVVSAGGEALQNKLGGAADKVDEIKRDPLGAVIDAGVGAARGAGTLVAKAENYLDRKLSGKTQEEQDQEILEGIMGKHTPSAAAPVRTSEKHMSDTELDAHRAEVARSEGWDGNGDWLDWSKKKSEGARQQAEIDAGDEMLASLEGKKDGTKQSRMFAGNLSQDVRSDVMAESRYANEDVKKAKARTVAEILVNKGYDEKILAAASNAHTRGQDVRSVADLLHAMSNGVLNDSNLIKNSNPDKPSVAAAVAKRFGSKASTLVNTAYAAGVHEGIISPNDEVAAKFADAVEREVQSSKQLGDMIVANLKPTVRDALDSRGKPGEPSYNEALSKLVAEVRRVTNTGSSGGNVVKAGKRSTTDNAVLTTLFGNNAEDIGTMMEAFYSPEKAAKNGGRKADSNIKSVDDLNSDQIAGERSFEESLEESGNEARTVETRTYPGGYHNVTTSEGLSKLEASEAAAKLEDVSGTRVGMKTALMDQYAVKHDLTPDDMLAGTMHRTKALEEAVLKEWPELAEKKPAGVPATASKLAKNDYATRAKKWADLVNSRANVLEKRYQTVMITNAEQTDSMPNQFSSVEIKALQLDRGLDHPSNSVENGTIALKTAKGGYFITSAPLIMRKMFRVKGLLGDDGSYHKDLIDSRSSKADTILLEGITSLLENTKMFSGEFGYVRGGKFVQLSGSENFPDNFRVMGQGSSTVTWGGSKQLADKARTSLKSSDAINDDEGMTPRSADALSKINALSSLIKTDTKVSPAAKRNIEQMLKAFDAHLETMSEGEALSKEWVKRINSALVMTGLGEYKETKRGRKYFVTKITSAEQLPAQMQKDEKDDTLGRHDPAEGSVIHRDARGDVISRNTEMAGQRVGRKVDITKADPARKAQRNLGDHIAARDWAANLLLKGMPAFNAARVKYDSDAPVRKRIDAGLLLLSKMSPVGIKETMFGDISNTDAAKIIDRAKTLAGDKNVDMGLDNDSEGATGVRGQSNEVGGLGAEKVRSATDNRWEAPGNKLGSGKKAEEAISRDESVRTASGEASRGDLSLQHDKGSRSGTSQVAADRTIPGNTSHIESNESNTAATGVVGQNRLVAKLRTELEEAKTFRDKFNVLFDELKDLMGDMDEFPGIFGHSFNYDKTKQPALEMAQYLEYISRAVMRLEQKQLGAPKQRDALGNMVTKAYRAFSVWNGGKHVVDTLEEGTSVNATKQSRMRTGENSEQNSEGENGSAEGGGTNGVSNAIVGAEGNHTHNAAFARRIAAISRSFRFKTPNEQLIHNTPLSAFDGYSTIAAYVAEQNAFVMFVMPEQSAEEARKLIGEAEKHDIKMTTQLRHRIYGHVAIARLGLSVDNNEFVMLAADKGSFGEGVLRSAKVLTTTTDRTGRELNKVKDIKFSQMTKLLGEFHARVKDANGGEPVEINWDRYTGANTEKKGNTAFSLEKALPKQATDEAITQAVAHLQHTLGGNIQADFETDFADGSSGSWTPNAVKNIIRIAMNGDVMGTAFHESFHEFMDILSKHGGKATIDVIRRAATSPIMLKQLDRLLEGHPEAQEQVRKDPDEAAAFMYQFWQAGKLNIGSQTKTSFQKIKDFLKRTLGLLAKELKAMEADENMVRDIMLSFSDGAVADMSKRQTVVKALNKSVEAHDLAQQRVGKEMGKLYGTAAKLVFSAEAMIEATGNKFMGKMSSGFHQKAGDAMGRQAYSDAVRMMVNQKLSKLEKLLSPYDAADVELAREGMSKNKRPTALEAGKAFDDMKAFFADMATYLEAKGVKRLDMINGTPTWVGIDFRKHYWPQVWDTDVLEKNMDEFRADLLKHHMKELTAIAKEANAEVARRKGAGDNTASAKQLEGMEEGKAAQVITPEMIADSLIVRIQNSHGQIDINEDLDDLGITPAAAAVNRRVLDWLDADVFEKYKSKDTARILTSYTANMVKRAEYQSRFGPGGEVLQDNGHRAILWEIGGDKLVKVAEDGLQPAIDAWKKAKAATLNSGNEFTEPFPTLRSVGLKHQRGIDGVEKVNEAHKAALSKLEQGFKAIQAMEGTLGRDISPNLRKFSSWAVTYQNVTKLSTMLFTSFQDVMGIVANGGEMNDAWDAFVEGIKSIKHSWTGSSDQGQWMARSEMWGAVDSASLQESLGQMYGSSFMTGTAKRVSDQFFKWTGAEGWNRGVRSVATRVAERTILEWKQNGVDAKDPAVMARVERLYGKGFDLNDIKLDAEGNLDATDPRNQAAVNRWVLDAVPTTNAAHRPIWGSDPHFQTFIQFKNYTYSFHRVMLKGALEQAKLGNYRPAMVLALGYMPIAIAGGAIKEMLIPGDEPPWMKGGLDGYLAYGFSKAGVLGVPQMYAQNLYDLDPAATFGPSVDQIQNLLSVPISDHRTVLGEGLGAVPYAGNILRRAA